MTEVTFQSVADQRVLYLTTVGRNTGLRRQIEIWFVVCRKRVYLFAELGEAAGWVKNVRRNPHVAIGIGKHQIDATARVLDPAADRRLWDEVTAIAKRKYGWGDGLPVEVTAAS
jgi:deazaflavin-dependent oxidoreductase (nitroreductase family)